MAGELIQKFADSGVQSAIDKALANLEPDKHGAVVAYATGEGVSLAVVGRVGPHWSVVGVLDKPWTGKLAGQAMVRFTW